MTVHPITVVVVALVVLVAFAVLVTLLVRYRRRVQEIEEQPTMSSAEPGDGGRRRAAVIVNPTKFSDVGAVREQVSRGFRQLGWDEPMFLETTEDDPGKGQAREALGRRGRPRLLARRGRHGA